MNTSLDWNTPPLGLQIWDITNRTSPVIVSSFTEVKGEGMALDRENSILFTWNQLQTLYALDVSEPNNVTVLDSIPGLGIEWLNFRNGYLYAGSAINGTQPPYMMRMFEFRPTKEIQASIEYLPHFLNKKRKFGFIVGFIELPEPYDVHNIDKGSVKISAIEGEQLSTPVPAKGRHWYFVDFNRNGKKELMVFFSRRKVIKAIGDRTGCLELILTGTIEGTTFSGTNSIKVFDWPHPLTLTESNTNIEELANLEFSFDYILGQNYPNPFNLETSINYQLPENVHVVIKIFNSLGQEIRTLENKQQQAGYYTIHWDGRDNSGKQVVSGIYLYQVNAGSFVCTKKMAVLK